MIRLNRVWTMPLRPESVFTGSAYTASISGVETDIDGYKVTGVSVVITNADGTPFTASARSVGGVWECTFAETCFTNYGFASRGLKIKISGTNAAGVTRTWTRGVGDFEVVADSSSAQPGDPANVFAVKGGDVYIKSALVSSVQHYVKQTMVYDAEMAAWGAEWGGDYILVNGEFVEAGGGEEDA